MPSFSRVSGLRWIVLVSWLAFGVASARGERAMDGVDRPAPGRWRATLDLNGHDLNFLFDLRPAGEGWRAEIRNAEEVIGVEAVTVVGGRVSIAFPHFDSKILATLGDDGRSMRGSWSVFRGDDKGTASVPFSAELTDGPRYRAASESEPGALPARWSVSFDDSDDPAVGVFEQSPGDRSIVTGTFLTTTGDYRFLEGVLDGDRLTLSAFDGAHAFLFEGRIRPDGSLLGVFYSGDWWIEAFHAVPDPAAALPDLFSLTRWERDADLGALTYPDLDGEPVNLGAFAAGSPTIIALTASWCPNCADAAGYLKELHERYAPGGLKIIALSFERHADFEKAAAQARKSREHHGGAYPVLVAGLADKDAASESLPALDRVRAYPSTIFVDRSGAVVAVHQGYAGPAAGAAHDELRARFERIIERMLTR